ncbi:hypothetical protein SAMN05421824_0053 [Hyunsoonleella jejuensis]|uniref:Auto-transporter adhesin head GIN domain-containing protein n=1 Tax=Hyunsoonleella jejuensis TaxID=419940 RepID=A0A1H8ZW88_9FLAO|nr:hypothetical protein [Hyunsoonleella jejuensis]SEP68517.1 hypothetical protein SAMN05421824_0053 [Hyunsoonleella jejuensis]
MKNLVTILALISFTFASAQNTTLEGDISKDKVTFENLNISVTVNSAEDIKRTFDVSDIKNIVLDVDDNEALSFTVTCENTAENSNSHLTYKVKGNTNDLDGFIKSIKLIRKSAIKYYKNKS